MKDSIVVSLPYPHKFLGLTISTKRNIGFLFTNLSMFLFRENNRFETNFDFDKWLKEHGETRYLIEQYYAAAQAYCMQTRTKQTFTKTSLTQAISFASEEVQKELLSAWKKSHEFGLVESKKKPKLKR